MFDSSTVDFFIALAAFVLIWALIGYGVSRVIEYAQLAWKALKKQAQEGAQDKQDKS